MIRKIVKIIKMIGYRRFLVDINLSEKQTRKEDIEWLRKNPLTIKEIGHRQFNEMVKREEERYARLSEEAYFYYKNIKGR